MNGKIDFDELRQVCPWVTEDMIPPLERYLEATRRCDTLETQLRQLLGR